jgi:hypothetical protein
VPRFLEKNRLENRKQYSRSRGALRSRPQRRGKAAEPQRASLPASAFSRGCMPETRWVRMLKHVLHLRGLPHRADLGPSPAPHDHPVGAITPCDGLLLFCPGRSLGWSMLLNRTLQHFEPTTAHAPPCGRAVRWIPCASPIPALPSCVCARLCHRPWLPRCHHALGAVPAS